jgi:hypothetical protein
VKENHKIESLEALSKSVSRKRIRRSNSPSWRIERSWHPGPTQAVLTAGSLAFLCVISLLLMLDIHPPPTELTIQSDAAELVRLETQLGVGDSHTETRSLPSSAVSKAGTERVDVELEKHSEFAAPKPTLIASRMSSAGRKREAGSGEAYTRPSKRGLDDGRANYVRIFQSQRPIAPTRQPNKLQGFGSFFSAMGRALAFSTRRDPL